jgi:hypothetical protein
MKDYDVGMPQIETGQAPPEIWPRGEGERKTGVATQRQALPAVDEREIYCDHRNDRNEYGLLIGGDLGRTARLAERVAGPLTALEIIERLGSQEIACAKGGGRP